MSAAWTVAFAATGVYALARLAALTSGSLQAGDRLVELVHLLMSLAMIAMAWGWTGPPGSPGGLVQIVGFGLVAVWFLSRALEPGSRLVHGYHALMAAAMVWMVATMPLLMGMPMTADGGGGHGHHGGGTDVVAAVPAGPTPDWASVGNWAFVVLCAAAAVFWVVRTARPTELRTEGDVVVRSRTVRRIDGGCHVVMSAGMGTMLVAMQ